MLPRFVLGIALLLWVVAAFLPRPEIGYAAIENGSVTAHNDRPFPVLSASKIIPAAMALERDRSLMPLVRKSVIDSDNQAADELTKRLGGRTAIQAWLHSKSLPDQFATEAEMVAHPTVYELRPSELALILYRIQSPDLLALMAQTKTGNDRIRAAHPGAPHKSGTAGRYLSDVGLANGKIIAVMGDGAAANDLARESAR